MTRHWGIYAIVIQSDAALLVQKARGPYTGLWDLPGGSPEHAESPLQTLTRELLEETGLHLASATLFDVWSTLATYPNSPETVHHLGVLYRATVHPGPLRTTPDGQDVAAARFLKLTEIDRNNLTPFARRALFPNT